MQARRPQLGRIDLTETQLKKELTQTGIKRYGTARPADPVGGNSRIKDWERLFSFTDRIGHVALNPRADVRIAGCEAEGIPLALNEGKTIQITQQQQQRMLLMKQRKEKM